MDDDAGGFEGEITDVPQTPPSAVSLTANAVARVCGAETVDRVLLDGDGEGE